MPIEITREPSGRIVGTGEGELSFEEILEALRGQWAASEGSDHPVLWDLRRAKTELSGDQVRQLAHFVMSGQGERRPARVALVASEDLLFGLLRMYEANRDQTLTSVRVFRSFEEADTWTKG